MCFSKDLNVYALILLCLMIRNIISMFTYIQTITSTFSRVAIVDSDNINNLMTLGQEPSNGLPYISIKFKNGAERLFLTLNLTSECL